MSFGLQVWDASGNMIYDSTQIAKGGVYVCTVIAEYGQSPVITFDGSSYPNLVGRQIRVVQVQAGAHSYIITQATYPYITMTARTLTNYVGGSSHNTVLRVFVV